MNVNLQLAYKQLEHTKMNEKQAVSVIPVILVYFVCLQEYWH